MAMCAVALCLVPAAGRVRASKNSSALREGPGADVVRTRCLTCHQEDIIRQQRLTHQGWEREVDKMVRWGAGHPAGHGTSHGCVWWCSPLTQPGQVRS